MNPSRTAARLGAATTLAAVLAVGGALALAAPASAHVSVSPSTTAAGGYAILTFSVPHGCDGSPTTKVAISIPEEITSVTPTRNPLWDVVVNQKRLAEPITDAHGNTVTKRDATVVYTAKEPLPDGYRDAFELSVQLPEDPGATLTFPTVQTCEKGESAWIEVAADGQDAEELELPAPAVTVTAAEGDGHGEDAEPVAAEPAESSDDGGSSTLSIVALVFGMAGLVMGLAALAQVRRRG